MQNLARGEAPRVSRRALLFVIASAFPPLSAAASTTTIFANESWYRERPEPEQARPGILRKTPPPAGPNSRSALRYTFQTDHQSLDVYAPAMTERLNRLTNVRLTARGKLVDLRSEGFGLEFWIASLQTK